MYDTPSQHLIGLIAGLVAVPALWLLLKLLRRVARWRNRPRISDFVARFDAAPPATRLAAALMVVTGTIHLALIGGHIAETPVVAVLFAIDGVGFVALAIAAFYWARWRRPAALWLLVTILAYVLWIVAGWETPEQVGIATKLIELFALGLLASLDQGRKFSWPRRAWRASRLAALTVFITAGVWVGGLAHPDSLHAHAAALLQEVPALATPEQQAAAAALLRKTRESLARYRDPAAAGAAGFHGGPNGVEKLQHFTNPANDAAILDPQRPQSLVYLPTRHGLVLVGAMFQMQQLGQPGPDPGGPLTQWHSHEGICISPAGGFTLTLQTPFWTCPLGAVSLTTHAMLHVWIVDNPAGGPFAAELDPAVQARLSA